MKKIITLEELQSTSDILSQEKKSIVLVGGCFDVLHAGHLAFLTESKKQGDILMVMLESDLSIRERKGEGRPVNDQHTRATILAAIKAVDYVLLLPHVTTNDGYDAVVLTIKPAIIATTAGDPGITHKKRQADRLGATVVPVMERMPEHATSSLLKRVKENL